MTEKPDYMQNASRAVYMCKTRGGMSEREAMMHTLAMHFQALDTECAAHEATKDALDQSHENGNQLVSELLDERAAHEATKAELQALRERVGAAFKEGNEGSMMKALQILRSPLPQPAADPLLSVLAEYHSSTSIGRHEVEEFREIATRHGLTITTIGGEL